jgi:hypothetical protein
MLLLRPVAEKFFVSISSPLFADGDLCNWRHSDGRELFCGGSRVAFALVVVQRGFGLSLSHGRSVVDS